MTRHTSRTHAPRVEALEDRTLPAVSIIQNGATIVVRGTNQAENVRILDNGDDARGAVTVFDGHHTFRSRGPVRNIRLVMNGGADRVSYTLRNTLRAGVSRLVTTMLMGGNDQFYADILGNLEAGSRLGVVTYGGAGADKIFGGATSVNIAAGARLAFVASGEAGNDHLSFDYLGYLDGQLVVRLDGGAGNDAIHNQIVPRQHSSPPPSNPPPVIALPAINVNPTTNVLQLDLSSLGLDKLGLGTIPDLTDLVKGLTVTGLDLSKLDLSQLGLGSIDLSKLNLDQLGISPDKLGIGFIDLDKLAQGVLCFNLLDPSQVDLSKVAAGLIDLNKLTQGQIDAGILQIDLSKLNLGGLLGGQTQADLRVLNLAALKAALNANIGLVVVDLSAMAQGKLCLGAIDLSANGSANLGLGILGDCG